MAEIASIFNDVLAPVTPGPSSGCTGAPARMVRTGARLLGSRPVKLRVEFPSDCGYRNNLYGMRSDLSFITGFLGRDTTHPRFMNAYADTRAAGLEVEFVFTEETLGYPAEVCRIFLTAESGETISLYTNSIGGGLFVISDLDGCPVDIQGYEYEALLFFHPMDARRREVMRSAAAEICPELNGILYGEGGGMGVLELKSGREFSPEELRRLRALPGVGKIRTCVPEHPVPRSRLRVPPFTTSAEFQRRAEETGLPLWRLAVEYEAAVSGWTGEQVLDYAGYLWSVVEASAARGEKGEGDMHGIVPCRAPQIERAFTGSALLPLGAASLGAPYALSIMEDSNCSGTIVCIPTGGSSGIVPGAVYGACKALGKGRDDMVKALLVAGLMGTFMYESRYNGAIGCQAEVGCASGMAAGALVYLLGGTAKQACDAASMGIQSVLGLVCDSMCALVQVPCFIRNMTCTSSAMVCANAAMAGLDAVVSVEEMTHAMTELGDKLLKNNLNFHGMNDSPTGLRLKEEQEKRGACMRCGG